MKNRSVFGTVFCMEGSIRILGGERQGWSGKRKGAENGEKGIIFQVTGKARKVYILFSYFIGLECAEIRFVYRYLGKSERMYIVFQEAKSCSSGLITDI